MMVTFIIKNDQGTSVFKTNLGTLLFSSNRPRVLLLEHLYNIARYRDVNYELVLFPLATDTCFI